MLQHYLAQIFVGKQRSLGKIVADFRCNAGGFIESNPRILQATYHDTPQKGYACLIFAIFYKCFSQVTPVWQSRMNVVSAGILKRNYLYANFDAFPL